MNQQKTSGPLPVDSKWNKSGKNEPVPGRAIKYEGARRGNFRFLSYYDTHSDFCGELFCTNSKLFD